MKTHFLALTMGFLFALGACTEEIIKIEKQTDTLVVERFIDRYFAGIDSTKIPLVVETPVQAKDEEDSVITIIQRDTVYIVQKDSIFIVTTEYDTIAERIHYYNDTLTQYLYPRGAWGFPMELEPIYTGFFAEVDEREISYQGSGSAFMIQYKKMDDALQAYSFDYGGQIVVLLNDKLTVDESMIPLWRELSRIFLKNEYSLDDSNPMSQRFPSDLIRWSNRASFPNEIDLIFE